MSEPSLHRRIEWTDKPVYANDGVTKRPLLAPKRPWLTVHYTGNETPYPADMDMVAFMRRLQAYAATAQKSNEYNWVIPPRMFGNGEVWEYAGDYLAAHSEGENLHAIGVLLVLGVGQKVPDPMVNAFKWLRHDLLARGRLAADHDMTPHRAMPGASTACPGAHVLARWDDFAAAWNDVPPPVVTPPIEEDDEMGVRQSLWKHADYKIWWLRSGADITRATGADYSTAVAEKWDMLEESGADANLTLQSALARNGLTLSDIDDFTT